MFHFILLYRFEVGIPDGLLHLLRTYGAPSGGEVGRKALYKRLYGILWVRCTGCWKYNINFVFSSCSLGRKKHWVLGKRAIPLLIPICPQGCCAGPDVVRDWVDPDTPTVSYSEL